MSPCIPLELVPFSSFLLFHHSISFHFTYCLWFLFCCVVILALYKCACFQYLVVFVDLLLFLSELGVILGVVYFFLLIDFYLLFALMEEIENLMNNHLRIHDEEDDDICLDETIILIKGEGGVRGRVNWDIGN